MSTQTTRHLYITAAWWSIVFLLTVVPWAVAQLIIEEGWIRYAALPLSIILPITFGNITDKLSNKKEASLESQVYEKGM